MHESDKTERILTKEEVHSLRSSMGTIQMACEILKTSCPEIHKKYVQMIIEHTDKCLKTVAD